MEIQENGCKSSSAELHGQCLYAALSGKGNLSALVYFTCFVVMHVKTVTTFILAGLTLILLHLGKLTILPFFGGFVA